MRRIVLVTVYMLLTSALTLGFFEVALRIRPKLVPLDLLLRFQEEVALDVAKRRRLPNRSQVWELDRDDGGPPLKLFKPFTEIEVDLSARQLSR